MSKNKYAKIDFRRKIQVLASWCDFVFLFKKMAA
uniref:Uncharacterized protein n=1 Tax=viral metagenome TaxID=1070528 RepID=A0A6C0F368_9ZZZZ